MVEMTLGEPQSAAAYDDRITTAVKTVLIEIVQILGSFKGKFVIVGGAVPWLLLENVDMPHVGTLDVDLCLNAEALGDGEYATLVEALQIHGYRQRSKLRRFQLVRQVAGNPGAPIDIIVDFLMPRDAKYKKNVPPLTQNFAVQRADGADLALCYFKMITINGLMPSGGTNCVLVPVSSIPAFLAMKGHAIEGRYKQKDAYDIYYSIRNYPGGPEALARECEPLLVHPSGTAGYGFINDKFNDVDGFGPTCVRHFVAETSVLGNSSAEQWQRDAYGQADAWLRALGLRK
jgi:hypothetical protein